MVGKKDAQDRIFTLALDRITKIELDLKHPYLEETFDADVYYQDTYGVTVMGDDQLLDVRLKVAASNAPYVLTKPFHHSQQLESRDEDGSIIITLRVHHNFELERLILGFGESIEVMAPPILRKRIRRKLQKALESYIEV